MVLLAATDSAVTCQSPPFASSSTRAPLALLLLNKGKSNMRACLFLLLALAAPMPAAAEITLNGEAKMGLTTSGGDVQGFSGARLTAHAHGVTDGGMEYGAVLDLDNSRYGDEAPRGYVYISGGNHSLKMGQGVNSAARDVVGTLPKVRP